MNSDFSFKKVALAFSGGGYRAATFSLGTLSCFNEVGILKEVEAISSVSGGSISAVRYAQSLIDNETFDDFYRNYYGFLDKDALADTALKYLDDKRIWKTPDNKHKRRNAINSYAIVYNDFTKHRTLGDFASYAESKGSTLKRLIINAADFTTSLTFRLQNLPSKSYNFGNSKTPNAYRSKWKQVKLGDALAASAAFPGGFEPISFPQDFLANSQKLSPIGLMDGGIIDNQGTSSYMTVKKKENKYGLFFVSDVASPYVYEPFKYAEESRFTKIISYLVSPILLLFLLVATIFFLINQYWILYSIGLIISVLMIAAQVGLILASNKLKKTAGLKVNLKLPRRRLGFYLLNRINSFLHMNSIVFLKSGRRGHANFLYGRYPDISITCAIYELRCKDGTPENSRNWDSIQETTGCIPQKMMKIAEKAAIFETTLWFSKEDHKENMLRDLVVCGEFTSCYNLIAYLVRHHKEGIKVDGSEAKAIFDKLIILWNKLKDNPYYILEKHLKG